MEGGVDTGRGALHLSKAALLTPCQPLSYAHAHTSLGPEIKLCQLTFFIRVQPAYHSHCSVHITPAGDFHQLLMNPFLNALGAY